MQCPECHGKGRVRGQVWCQTGPFEAILPCARCAGQGVVHCCEGENIERMEAMLHATDVNPNEAS